MSPPPNGPRPAAPPRPQPIAPFTPREPSPPAEPFVTGDPMRFSSRSRPGRVRRVCPRVEQLDDRTLPSITGTTGFAGLDFPGTGDGATPDTIAAAGPNYVVEMV